MKLKRVKQIIPMFFVAMLVSAVFLPRLPVEASFAGSDGGIAYTKMSIDESGVHASLATNTLEGGSETALITSSEYGPLGVRFSADGKKLTYSRLSLGSGAGDVYTSNLDGSSQVNVSDIDTESYPERNNYRAIFSSLSPDGSKVVFGEAWDVADESRCHIFIANSDGSDKNQLTDNSNECDMYPVFSPDGEKIAFIRTSTELVGEDEVGRNRIYTINADGSNQESLYTFAGRSRKISNPEYLLVAAVGLEDGQASPIDWSPEGDRILFSEIHATGEDSFRSRLATVDLMGSVNDLMVNNQVIDEGVYTISSYTQAQFTPEGNIIYKEILLTENLLDNDIRIQQYIRLADSNGEVIDQLFYQDVPIVDDGEVSMSVAIYNYGLPSVYKIQDVPVDGSLTATLTNPVNNKDILVTAGGSCTALTSASAVLESSLGAQDPVYTYESGIVGFTVSGCSIGDTANISMIFVGLAGDSSRYVARKYNPDTGAYKNIPGARVQPVVHSGQSAMRLSYDIVDGGELDLDGQANGVIVDPVGLGVVAGSGSGGAPSPPLASTGQGRTLLFVLAIAAIVSSGLAVSVIRKQAKSAKASKKSSVKKSK